MSRPVEIPARIPASMFSIVLGLSGLGQSWRVAARLWDTPAWVGEAILGVALLVWLGLLLSYALYAWREPGRTIEEFRHPVAGSTPALVGIATMLICQAVLPHSRGFAWAIAIFGLAWHLLFSVWHTGTLWQGGRQSSDSVPTLYLPTVAGNFTSAAALGALGATGWAWLLLGMGVFSWLALRV
jgi:tellurite resistance protein